jgi:tetratricopeptide (TPR) repeat protein
MRIGSFHVALAILGSSVPLVPAFADCKIVELAELPITMSGMSPTVTTKINGAEAVFIADSGAFHSVITPASAARFKLKLRPAPFNFTMTGVGGTAEVSLTTVDEFTFANVPIPRVEFVVGGSEHGNGIVGLLGQNVFNRIADVEYDLANGAIRLMRPGDGCRKADLAYWATSVPYSVIDIAWATAASPHTKGTAFINGIQIRVMFDTGASTSMLSLGAARRAGVKPGGAGVVSAGSTHGVGRRSVESWIAPFSSFKIGGEEVRNTRLRIADIELRGADMLIGADFFLSHRIYVANGQEKLYFTYNGGPVFNLAASPVAQAGSEPSPEASPQSQDTPEEPTDAAGFSRRGTAYAARRDFEHAIADLTRACELEPNEAKYFYQRALARLNNRQLPLAMTDLDQALALKPDDLDALVARAKLRLASRDSSGSSFDLEAADRLAPKEAEIRLEMAEAYSHVDLFARAVAQYNLWIGTHEHDGRMAEAKNGRCWARALWGIDLDKALADCNAALRLSNNASQVLDSRGLVRLRLGDYDKSIADYDEALSLQPKNAWSLYGRGLGKLRKGMTAEGQTDIAAATALQPRIADEARKHGIVP